MISENKTVSKEVLETAMYLYILDKSYGLKNPSDRKIVESFKSVIEKELDKTKKKEKPYVLTPSN